MHLFNLSLSMRHSHQNVQQVFVPLKGLKVRLGNRNKDTQRGSWLRKLFDHNNGKSRPVEAATPHRMVVRVPIAITEAEKSESFKLYGLRLRPVPGRQVVVEYQSPANYKLVLSESLPEGKRRWMFSFRTGELREVFPASSM
jgi:hypothetical protein